MNYFFLFSISVVNCHFQQFYRHISDREDQLQFHENPSTDSNRKNPRQLSLIIDSIMQNPLPKAVFRRSMTAWTPSDLVVQQHKAKLTSKRSFRRRGKVQRRICWKTIYA